MNQQLFYGGYYEPTAASLRIDPCSMVMNQTSLTKPLHQEHVGCEIAEEEGRLFARATHAPVLAQGKGLVNQFNLT